MDFTALAAIASGLKGAADIGKSAIDARDAAKLASTVAQMTGPETKNLLREAGEFTMTLGSGSVVGSSRLVQCRIAAQPEDLSEGLNVGPVSAAAGDLEDALHARLAVSTTPPVLRILRSRTVTQIAERVVGLVAIDVVDEFLGPCPSHVQPR